MAKKPERRKISDTELQQILADHRKWIKSGTIEGKRDGEIASLRDADLSHADLRRADLSSADLSNANLNCADLSRADLRYVNLSNGFLSGTNLRGADLSHAILTDSYLSDADLSNAFLIGANLRGANLKNANFSDASLSHAILSDASLSHAILSDASLGHTVFANIDLSTVKGLEKAKHRFPSSIGIDTIYMSKGIIPDVFLRGCGLDENFIQHISSFVNQPIQFYSCFISYSHKDKSFAQRVHDQLQGKEIRCWLDDHQILPGDDIYKQVDRGISFWDKVLLCCSESSLTSWWVDNELSTAFKKEQRLMKNRRKKVLVLIPLNLDDYMFSDEWESGKKTQVLERLAADFKGWEKNNDKFEKQFERVVNALRTGQGGREIPPEPQL